MKLLGRKTAKSTKTSAPMVKSSKTASVAKVAPTHDEIAKRAYEIYLARGEGGNEAENWLQAEAELSR